MSARAVTPWLQTGAGVAFDLVAPTAAMIDFIVDVPEALARIPRFTGHIRSGPYSVAQHCVAGADAVLRDTGRADFAAAFLLHDAHEAYVGDIATPIAAALATIARSEFQKPGYDAGHLVRAVFKTLKFNIDRAVHEAAGVAWPLPAPTREIVHLYDLRMLQTERLQLLGPAPRSWGDAIDAVDPVRMTGKLKIWPWPEAADQYRDRLRRWLPRALDRAA